MFLLILPLHVEMQRLTTLGKPFARTHVITNFYCPKLRCYAMQLQVTLDLANSNGSPQPGMSK